MQPVSWLTAMKPNPSSVHGQMLRYHLKSHKIEGHAADRAVLPVQPSWLPGMDICSWHTYSHTERHTYPCKAQATTSQVKAPRSPCHDAGAARHPKLTSFWLFPKDLSLTLYTMRRESLHTAERLQRISNLHSVQCLCRRFAQETPEFFS